MQTQHINREDTEKIFMVVHNVEATSITRGQGASYVGMALAQVSNDGHSVVRSTTDTSMMDFAGIAQQDIVADGFGLVQAWGFVDSIMCSHRAGNTTIDVADFTEAYLIPSATLPGTFTSTNPDLGLSRVAIIGGAKVQIWETVGLSMANGTPIFGKGFVRAI